jgi:hypothetical protein
LGEEKKHLNLSTSYASSKSAKTFIKASTKVERFKKEEGLPGSIWKSKKNGVLG